MPLIRFTASQPVPGVLEELVIYYPGTMRQAMDFMRHRLPPIHYNVVKVADKPRLIYQRTCEGGQSSQPPQQGERRPTVPVDQPQQNVDQSGLVSAGGRLVPQTETAQQPEAPLPPEHNALAQSSVAEEQTWESDPFGGSDDFMELAQ